MRVFSAVGATAVAVAATALLAPVASADAPGDNGTIKIHDAKTGEELVKNEPHVCTFYLDAFFFDGRQQAAWEIDTQAPTTPKDVEADSGSITLDGQGHGRTADISLPDGHYKLTWNFDGEHGKAKQKVFWVDCSGQTGSNGGSSGGSNGGGANGGSTSGSNGGSNGGSPTGGSTGGGATGGPTGGTGASGGSAGSTVTGGSSGGATPTTGTDTGTATASSSAAAAGSSGTPGSGSLASTGTSVIGVSALAAVLLAGGVAVRFRRKGARRHL
ncbi:hypothetical protein VSR01_33880 [Actinacidiphila sp. DG2A-62]|uniref:hypothetical protein n=1 Tax=Actinacidiphila sp. DG2A-62 TaxID=3108821 RepID=UPI002DB96A27|nr:hypothetical protein [Actinacidiphila sp. DG2A-62]MEC3998214.1 hypothetical protein [Actinacidiphila sp. DG2A-62]